MTKVIVNADDLGISLEVNRRIEDAIIAGAITSSTIIANGPAFDDALRISKQYPQISFGVHLNIIEFKPLSDSSIFKSYSLLNDDGDFIEGAIYGVQKIGKDLIEAIHREFSMQIEKVKIAGVDISHIDSHQHTHAIYAFKAVILSLMKEYQIDKVRRCRIPSIKLMLWGKAHSIKLDKSKAVNLPPKNVILRRFNLFIIKYKCFLWIRLFQSSSKITDCFYSYQVACDNWKLLKKQIDGKCIELMCHPSHPAYERETQMVFDKELERYTRITYISYNDL